METSRPTPDQEPAGDPRIDAAMQVLESGVDRLIDSDEFKSFLEFQAKFHRYSFNNQMLIWAQKPDATRVMGYGSKAGNTGWKSLGRQVRSGERAIKIFAPMIRKETDTQTGERLDVVRGFKLVNVFDVSQTDGDDLPEHPGLDAIESDTERGRVLYGWTADHLADHGIPVFRQNVPGNDRAQGSYHPGEHPKIYVRPDLATDMAAKVLVHEASHFTADHKPWENRADIETVAEGAAFVTTTHFGLDTSQYSFGYVGHWAKDRDVFKRNLGMIQQTAKTLITGIEGVASRHPSALPERDFSPVFLSEGLPQRLPSSDELRR